MRIAMFTNTFLPLVGGASLSIERFTRAFRALGHEVLVVAPEYDDQPNREEDVIRVSAIKRFNGTRFSFPLPYTSELVEQIGAFDPDIIHAHHPYLLGDTALVAAAALDRPVLLTHHTAIGQIEHYLPKDSPRLRNAVLELMTRHANLCDGVIAPSESTARHLLEQGVTSPIRVVPTGVDFEQVVHGDGGATRQSLGVPADAFLIGHVGQLAPENNLGFLARVLCRCFEKIPGSCALIVGCGPSRSGMERTFIEYGVAERVRWAGVLKGPELADAYNAMDVFAFSSKTESQGMVLVEAMASKCPVVALDAPGSRDIVRDGVGGRLLQNGNDQAVSDAICEIAALPPREGQVLRENAFDSVRAFDMKNCAHKALEFYREVSRRRERPAVQDRDAWPSAVRSLERRWDLWRNRASAIFNAFLEMDGPR